jgi:hypothetical protein
MGKWQGGENTMDIKETKDQSQFPHSGVHGHEGSLPTQQ